MYVYFEPKNGFNDILYNVLRTLKYCSKKKRILLVNGRKTLYGINFSQYFAIPEYARSMIIDTEEIKKICSKQHYTVYPNNLKGELINMLNALYDESPLLNPTREKNDRAIYAYKNTVLSLPVEKRPEHILIHSRAGGGGGYALLNKIQFHKGVLDIFRDRYKRLDKPYLAIHIRNTDYKCDYEQYFFTNEILIRSFKQIYVATDDVNAIEFYRRRGLNLTNFTTFPKETAYISLHSTNIDGHTKFIDMLCDMFIMGLAEKLLSNSKGGFIELARSVHQNKPIWMKRLL